MDYDILGGFVSKTTIDDFDKLDKRVEQSSQKISELIAKMGTLGMGTDYSKFANDLAAANSKILKLEQQVNTEKQRKIKLSIEEKVAAQALAAQQKINATATSEQVTQLQRLTAQMKVLEMEMQSKFNPALKEQSAEFITLNAQHQKMQAEFGRTARATGVMGRSMNSSYGSTFQLTQVMRELPNFAIDARVGFMALSNNLPMLADSFKLLKQQIIDTEGAAGAGRKTWAAFGKSLLSLNTIMIVASTLLVLFGDDIVDWIGKVFKGEKFIQSFTQVQKALIDQMEKTGNITHSTTKEVTDLGVAIDKYKKGTGDADAIVKDYNTTLGIHYGKLKTIDEVMAAYPQKARDFIRYTIAMQASMEEAGKASDAMLKVEGIKRRNALLVPDEKDKTDLREFFNAMLKGQEDVEIAGALLAEQQKQGRNDAILSEEQVAAARARAHNRTVGKLMSEDKEYSLANKQMLLDASDLEKRIGKDKVREYVSNLAKQKVASAQYGNAFNAAVSLRPAELPGETKPTGGGGGGATQTAKSLLIAEEYYNKQRALLVEEMSKTELQINETTKEGVIIAFKDREDAARKFYAQTTALAEIDKAKQLSDMDEKFLIKDSEITKTRADNRKKLADNKITQEEFNTAELANGLARTTLIGNLEKDVFKIKDDYRKKDLDAARKLVEQNFAISQDRYAKEIQLLKISSEEKQKLIEKNYEEQKATAARKSTAELTLGALTGGTVDKSFNEVAALKDKNKTILDEQMSALDAELSHADTSGKRKYAIALEQSALSKKLIENQADYELRVDNMVKDKKSEILKSSLENMVELMTTIWEKAFEEYFKMLDEELAYETKINDERLKIVEDKENAGVMSKKEAADEKLRIEAYQLGQEEDIAKRKAEAEKTKFLVEQGMALAKIAIETAKGVIVYGANPLTAPLVPSIIALGATQAAIVMAQTIPAFAEGGTMGKDGKAVIGDGGKNELVMTPTGDWYVSPKIPTVVDMKAGTKIYPDVNKIDLNSFLAMAQVQPQKSYDMFRLETEMRGLRKDLSKQKTPRISTQRLFDQINSSERISRRKRGLMN